MNQADGTDHGKAETNINHKIFNRFPYLDTHKS